MEIEKTAGGEPLEIPGGFSWNFLEEEADACAVVTRRMEVIFLNPAARRLVPRRWFGCRCWEIFPVGDESCAARCPAVRAVSRGSEIIYCEETLFPRGGEPVPVGVAVIPVAGSPEDGQRAVLLIRPKPAGAAGQDFRGELLARAEALHARIEGLKP